MMDLPQDCIAKIIHSTSPKDACRISSTAKILRSISDSDDVWLHFLPSDYPHLISRSSDDNQISREVSKKQAYLRLSDAGLLIDDGTKHFSIERSTGKKRFMIGARSIHITWGDTPSYWKWIRVRGSTSRVREIAELSYVWWLEIRTRIRTRELSPATKYGAFLVFKMLRYKGGFVVPAEVAVEVTGESKNTGSVYLDVEEVEERDDAAELPVERDDGWMEVAIGEFLVGDGDGEREVEVSFMETQGLVKRGLVVEGIEFRPK